MRGQDREGAEGVSSREAGLFVYLFMSAQEREGVGEGVSGRRRSRFSTQ